MPQSTAEALQGKTDEQILNELWDALRLEGCATGLKAHCIVMLHKDDIKKALKRLRNETPKAETTQ